MELESSAQLGYTELVNVTIELFQEFERMGDRLNNIA
jgi:hypothetical protein